MFKVRKATPRTATVDKAKGATKEILDRLKGYLTAEEPEAVEFLVRFWDTQAKGVTYAELREAVLAGDLTQAQLDKWQREYSALINTKLAPGWEKAMAAAERAEMAKYPFLYEPSIAAAQNYIVQHGAELVTNLVAEQSNALRALIANASGYNATTADELARLMRPVIGLTTPQTLANGRYYESVKTALLKDNPKMRVKTAEKRAREAAAKYAGKQHRYRAMNIARTELAYAYNAGGYNATLDAQSKGYIGAVKKKWLTADDERVCPICGEINGETRNMSDLFSIGCMYPPAHPSCRCAVAYEEIDDTNITPTATAHEEAGKVEPLERQPDLSFTVDAHGNVTENQLNSGSKDGIIEIPLYTPEQQAVRDRYDPVMLQRMETKQKPAQYSDEWFDGEFYISRNQAPTEIEGRIAMYTTTNDWADYTTEKTVPERNAARKRVLAELQDIQSVMPINSTTLYRAEEVNARHAGIAVGETLSRAEVQSWSKSKKFADTFLEKGEFPDGFGVEGDEITGEWIIFKTKGAHRDINVMGYSPFEGQEESLMSGTYKITGIKDYRDGQVRLVEVEVQDQPKAGDKLKKEKPKTQPTTKQRPTMREKWTDPDFAQEGYFDKFESETTKKARTYSQIVKGE